MEENKSIELQYNELKVKYDNLTNAIRTRNENVTEVFKIITSSLFFLSFSSFAIVILQNAL
ncbi:hypothetical protein EHN65_24930 [Salmonella enterica]|uniref:hypothetical protein n=1 Tax=Enterobacter hormaechei TaxID=158836 RepID=UPI001285AFEA|nr:hypothetical protein [Salmonella enterica]ECB7904192.1 hypothetical protein [Salmonella enterica subsp. enterica serovar Braenderup]EAW1591109.1 hypothetical protein [Salmonella enterica]EBE0820548.1 hypothetical protein [Salmonella enterica]EBF0735402.1 hypothetical protein [Salmonella enterica]